MTRQAPTADTVQQAIRTLGECLAWSEGADAAATLWVLVDVLMDGIENRQGSECECCRAAADGALAHLWARLPTGKVQ
jgi:hypothetical protein